MANPPKQKGTAGETELLKILQPWIPGLVRAPSSSIIDLKAPGNAGLEPLQALATRPDRGRWLVSVEADVFGWLVSVLDAVDEAPRVEIEVKRFKKFAHHTIFEGKFGGR